jgi:hypothetical protein
VTGPVPPEAAPPRATTPRYSPDQLAVVSTIGGEWLLVDRSDEDAPIARFSTQGDAMFVASCIERTPLAAPAPESGTPTEEPTC